MDPQPKTQSLKKSSLVIIPTKSYDEDSEQCVMHLSIVCDNAWCVRTTDAIPGKLATSTLNIAAGLLLWCVIISTLHNTPDTLQSLIDVVSQLCKLPSIWMCL